MVAHEGMLSLRKACECGSDAGEVENRNGQWCVLCAQCGRYQYCASKVELGIETRSVSSSRSSIKPKQRFKILERANGACEVCHRHEGVLHVGHLLSVADGTRLGLSESLINCDENLIAMCEECNLGAGKQTLPLRLVAAILHARTEAPING